MFKSVAASLCAFSLLLADGPVVKTGQTVEYYPGDDGTYQAGLARSYTRSAAGVVTDHATGLAWQDDYSDNERTIKTADWQGAIDYCAALGLDGGGWRLPTVEELSTIVDRSVFNPAMYMDDRDGLDNDNGFERVATSGYWSSTTFASDTSYAWFVDFYDGLDFRLGKTLTSYVRCVRGGQSFDH